MLNKNVCPNCGQLYDTNLSKCPLCGTAPQVVDTGDPVQRKRITEAERKQRRAERKEAEQEARRRRKDAQFMRDADEEREYEEEEARRKEEKRRRKEEKKAARRALEAEEDEDEAEQDDKPAYTAAPARDGRGPMPETQNPRDPHRVPRIFLILSALALLAALAVGGSYLLWKLDVVDLPIYDQLVAKRDGQAEEPLNTETPADPAMSQPADSTAARPSGDSSIPCTGVTLSQTELTFEQPGQQDQLIATLSPSNTTEDRSFTSSDTAVVKVSPVGIVTAIGPGEAVITVSCGSKSATCSVVCTFDEASTTTEAVVVDHLELIKDDMTFKAPGENYVLSVTNLPAGTEVSWRSLDESICTVDEKGHVVAVGAGTTRVIASYGSLTAECWVRCRFE